MPYSDHEFEGNQNEPCKALIPKYNPTFRHDVEAEFCVRCNSPVIEEVTGYFEGQPNSWWRHCQCEKSTLLGNRDEIWVCATDMESLTHDIHQKRTLQPCGASWTSVLHPPDQFRHWCSILDAGGDCMHMEFED